MQTGLIVKSIRFHFIALDVEITCFCADQSLVPSALYAETSLASRPGRSCSVSKRTAWSRG